MSKPTREFLYGLNPCFEALRAGRRRVYGAFINDATRNSARLQKLTALLERNSVPVDFVDKGRLQQLCGSHEHQGAVLRCGTYPYVPFTELLELPRLLLLDNLEDPHNVGAILRTAEVFGFHGVFLPLKGVPEIYPSVIKVSAGAAEFMQIARDRNANQYVREAIDHGYIVLSLDAKGSMPVHALPDLRGKKVLLVVGGEDKAVGQFILNLSHHVVRIEQEGQVNSLNASVAAGVALYALASQGAQGQATEIVAAQPEVSSEEE